MCFRGYLYMNKESMFNKENNINTVPDSGYFEYSYTYFAAQLLTKIYNK